MPCDVRSFDFKEGFKMNKMMKKTLAAAMALSLVGGGLPAITGGTDIFKSAIVADAATTVTVANGAYFHKGDTLDFGTGSYVSVDYYEDSLFISGTQSFTNAGIIHGDEDTYGYIKIGDEDVDCSLFPYADGNSDMLNSFEGVWGYIVCGDGTEESPYYFCPLLQELAAVTYSYANVTLDDSVTLNFYADKPSLNALGVDSVTLTGPNGEKSYTTFENGGNSCYIFRYPLYATQLDEDVTIQFKKGEDIVQVIVYDEEENAVVPKNSLSYNINTYCDEILEDEEGYYADEEINAVQSLKNLGIAADNYFDNTSTPISFLDSDYSALSAFAPTFNSTQGKLSLVLDSKLSARLYIEGLTAGVESQAYDTFPTYTSIAGKDGKACFELANLDPTDLGGIYNIKYNDVTYDFSALSYCARAINSANPKAVDVAKAVYEYFKYIEAYQNWAMS